MFFVVYFVSCFVYSQRINAEESTIVTPGPSVITTSRANMESTIVNPGTPSITTPWASAYAITTPSTSQHPTAAAAPSMSGLRVSGVTTAATSQHPTAPATHSNITAIPVTQQHHPCTNSNANSSQDFPPIALDLGLIKSNLHLIESLPLFPITFEPSIQVTTDNHKNNNNNNGNCNNTTMLPTPEPPHDTAAPAPMTDEPIKTYQVVRGGVHNGSLVSARNNANILKQVTKVPKTAHTRVAKISVDSRPSDSRPIDSTPTMTTASDDEDDSSWHVSNCEISSNDSEFNESSGNSLATLTPAVHQISTQRLVADKHIKKQQTKANIAKYLSKLDSTTLSVLSDELRIKLNAGVNQDTFMKLWRHQNDEFNSKVKPVKNQLVKQQGKKRKNDTAGL